MFDAMVRNFLLGLHETQLPPGFPAPLLPGSGRAYASAPVKVAYFGIETYGWLSLPEIAEAFQKDEAAAIGTVRDAATESLARRDHLQWWKGGRSPFWSFVLRTQAMLVGANYEDLREAGSAPDALAFVDTFAWGNLLPIERFLTARESSPDLTRTQWAEIQNMAAVSLPFLKPALTALQPHVCVFTYWDGTEDLLSGIPFQKVLHDDHFALYNLADPSIAIIWTRHPRSMLRHGGLSPFVERTCAFIKEAIQNGKL